MSNAQTCGKCKTAGKVFASSVESILLQASVYVEVDIEGNARDGDVEDYYTVVARDIKKVTIEAFAHAISTARARDGKCTGSGYISVGAGEEDDLNTATCTYDVKATERKVVKDAIAVAVGGAALSVCDTEFSIPKYKIEAEVCPSLTSHMHLPVALLCLHLARRRCTDDCDTARSPSLQLTHSACAGNRLRHGRRDVTSLRYLRHIRREQLRLHPH